MSFNRASAIAVFVAFVAFLLIPAGYGQTMLYVDVDAPPGGDGTSWPTAYQDFQNALAAAGTNGAVEEIRVAERTYTPAGAGGDPAASFELIEGVALYGGLRIPICDPAGPESAIIGGPVRCSRRRLVLDALERSVLVLRSAGDSPLLL
ncbi:MAG: hypothetical protein V2A79_02595 [Planctomycetota bacterium]